jgi:hypothetical protein
MGNELGGRCNRGASDGLILCGEAVDPINSLRMAQQNS